MVKGEENNMGRVVHMGVINWKKEETWKENP
jgi:hypothetical protein